MTVNTLLDQIGQHDTQGLFGFRIQLNQYFVFQK